MVIFNSVGLTTVTAVNALATKARLEFPTGVVDCSTLYLTSSAVIGRPVWNVTSLRRVMSIDSLSGLSCHCVARTGFGSSPTASIFMTGWNTFWIQELLRASVWNTPPGRASRATANVAVPPWTGVEAGACTLRADVQPVRTRAPTARIASNPPCIRE